MGALAVKASSTDWNLLMALATGFALQRAGIRLMAAESCTGGLLSHCLTRVGGSSQWFDGGVVSYSNNVKMAMLGVSEVTLQRFGAVSEEIAQEMAQGLMSRFVAMALRPSDEPVHDGLTTLAITGVAGPQGGTADKPVGLVCFAWAGPFGLRLGRKLFEGDRNAIQHQAAYWSMSNMVGFILKSKHSH